MSRGRVAHQTALSADEHRDNLAPGSRADEYLMYFPDLTVQFQLVERLRAIQTALVELAARTAASHTATTHARTRAADTDDTPDGDNNPASARRAPPERRARTRREALRWRIAKWQRHVHDARDWNGSTSEREARRGFLREKSVRDALEALALTETSANTTVAHVTVQTRRRQAAVAACVDGLRHAEEEIAELRAPRCADAMVYRTARRAVVACTRRRRT